MKILDVVLESGYLGDADSSKFQITLYDVPNKPLLIADIKRNIEKVTKKFQFIVLSPRSEYTNIKILDIDL